MTQQHPCINCEVPTKFKASECEEICADCKLVEAFEIWEEEEDIKRKGKCEQ